MDARENLELSRPYAPACNATCPSLRARCFRVRDPFSPLHLVWQIQCGRSVFCAAAPIRTLIESICPRRFWLFKPDEAPYQLKSSGDIAAGVQVEVYKHLLPDVHAVHQPADYTKVREPGGLRTMCGVP